MLRVITALALLTACNSPKQAGYQEGYRAGYRLGLAIGQADAIDSWQFDRTLEVCERAAEVCEAKCNAAR